MAPVFHVLQWGGGGVTSSTITTALGYTPADGASVTTSIASVSSTVFSVSSTVNSLNASVTALAASFAGFTSSQWSVSGSTVYYSSGGVGIGTSSTGAAQLVITKDQDALTDVYLSNLSSGTAAGARMGISTATAQMFLVAYSASNTTFGGEVTNDVLMYTGTGSRDLAFSSRSVAGSIKFYTGGNPASTRRRMTIDSLGNIGIATSMPVTRLDVSGGVRVGYEGGACSTSLAGTIRYIASSVEYCNGAAWTTFSAGAVTSSSVITALGYTPVNTASLTTVNSSITSLSSSANSVSSTVISLSSSYSALAVSYSALASAVAAVSSSQWVSSGAALNYSAGNVGIGTANPSQALDVSGTTRTSKFLVGDGAFNNPSIAFINSPSTGFYNSGGNLGISVGGSLKGTWASSSLSFNAGGAGPQIYFTGGSEANPSYAFNVDSDTGMFNPNAGGGSNELAFSTSGTEKVRISSAGTVGIGVTVPTARLHLASGTATYAALKINSGTLTTTPQPGAFEYDGSNFYVTDGSNTRKTIVTDAGGGAFYGVNALYSNSNMSVVPNGSFVVSSTTAATNSSTGALVVKGGLGVAGDTYLQGALNVSGTTRLAGPVGIGTASPLAALEVRGILRVSSSTSSYMELQPTQDISALNPGTATTTAGILQGVLNSSMLIDLRNNNADDAFAIRYSAGNTGNVDSIGMVLNGSGNLGLATSNPTVRLDVKGNIRSFAEENFVVISAETFSDANMSPHFIGYRARGTAASPQYPQKDDYLVSLHGRDAVDKGYNGGIIIAAEETFSANSKATSIRFNTASLGTSAPTERLRIGASGTVGIGTSAGTDMLHVLTNATNVSTGMRGIFSQYQLNQNSAANSNFVVALQGQVQIQSGNTQNLTSAISNGGINGVTGSVTATSGATGTATNVFAIKGNINNSSAMTFTNAYGLSVANMNGLMTNAVGIAVSGVTAGTNNTYLLMGTAMAPPAGNYGVYNGSTYDNYFAGDIGVGVSSPAALIHAVSSSTTAQGAQILVENTSASGPAYFITKAASAAWRGLVGQDATGANSFAVGDMGSGNSTLQFLTGSSLTEKMRIDTNGNVGIGVTGTVSAPLDVAGTAFSAENIRLRGKSATEGGQITLMDGVGTGGWEIDNYGANGNERLRVFRDKGENNVTEPLIVAHTGYVGVNNTAPTATLSVGTENNINSGTNFANGIGAFRISDGSPIGLLMDTNQIEQLDPTNAIYLNYNSSATAVINYGGGYAGIGTVPQRLLHIAKPVNSEFVIEQSDALANYRKWNFVVDSGNATTPSRMYIRQLNDALNGGNVVMTMTASGNVGINTQTPGSKLEVSGSDTMISTGLGSTFRVIAPNSSNSDYFQVGWLSEDNWAIMTADSATHRNLVVTPWGGNLGVGNVNPSYKLDVGGDIRITGTPYRNGGDSAWIVPSDARLKDVTGKYSRGLREIANIETIYFNYKKDNVKKIDPSVTYTGVIAQEVQKQIPEAVKEDKDGFLSLNTTPIFWALINAVKEIYFEVVGIKAENVQLKNQTEEQARKIQSLEQENHDIKKRLERLEQSLQNNK